MNIFVFPLTYPNERNKMANIFTYEQVKELSKNNKITVLYVQLLPTRMLFNRKKREIVHYNDGVTDVYYLQMHTFKFSELPKINALIYKRYAKKLFTHVLEECGVPDLVYAHFTLYAGWAAAHICKNYNIPLVIQEHDGSIISKRLKKFPKKCLSYTTDISKKFICVSNDLKKKMEDIVSNTDKYTVIGNMVDSKFKYVPRIKKEAFVFVAVGNLYVGKHMDLLIKAFCKAFVKEDKVSLRICGEGECRSELEKIIKLNEREEQVVLLGRCNRDEIYEEYKYCDCFVLPSDHETFGIVYREAMAVGRPVITTNHGGFAENEFLKEDGVMIEKNNEEELIKALKFIYLNIDNYSGKEISERCLQKYSPDNISKQINDILYKASIKGGEENGRKFR